MLIATLVSRCSHCHGAKVRGWMPFCVTCINRLPPSCRLDLSRLDDVADGFANAGVYLARGGNYEHVQTRFERITSKVAGAVAGVYRAISFSRVGRRATTGDRGMPVVPVGADEPCSGAVTPIESS